MYRSFLVLEDRKLRRLGVDRLKVDPDAQAVIGAVTSLARSGIWVESWVGRRAGIPGIWVKARFAPDYRAALVAIVAEARGRKARELSQVSIRAEHLNARSLDVARKAGLVL